ncbi:MAG: hypothetical protein RBS40_00295 [Rhodocyclaceae bacterium]|jgi:gp16 family phage-associated protein|nr:hypothetical protein [Rhodocyclaceae bacterium]
MEQKQGKTLEQVRDEFNRRGEAVSHWARRHGIDPEIARGVLSGRIKGKRGQAHKAAVLLGIKEGEIVEEEPYEEGQEHRSGGDRREGEDRRGAA